MTDEGRLQAELDRLQGAVKAANALIRASQEADSREPDRAGGFVGQHVEAEAEVLGLSEAWVLQGFIDIILRDYLKALDVAPAQVVMRGMYLEAFVAGCLFERLKDG